MIVIIILPPSLHRQLLRAARNPINCVCSGWSVTEVQQVSSICVGIDRIDDELPVTRQGYIGFVEQINEIVLEEICVNDYKEVVVAGLLHGGPLLTYAIATAPSRMYDKMYIMNPSFGTMSPDLDKFFIDCVQSGQSDCSIQGLSNNFGDR